MEGHRRLFQRPSVFGVDSERPRISMGGHYIRGGLRISIDKFGEAMTSVLSEERFAYGSAFGLFDFFGRDDREPKPFKRAQAALL